jgi:Tfp pilus assembly protein PilF
MKRILIIVTLLVMAGGGAAYYSKFGGSPEVKRDRALNSAREYMKQAKVNEAVIEYKNALKADPASAQSHYELAMALLKRGEYRPAYQELIRATDLKPDLVHARFQLANLYLLGRDTNGAKESLKKIRQHDQDAKEGYYLAAQIAMVEKEPDTAIKELEQALAKEPEKAAIYVDIGQVHVSKKEYRAA